MPKRREINDVIRPRRRQGPGGGGGAGGAGGWPVLDVSGPYTVETGTGPVQIMFSGRDPGQAYIMTDPGSLYVTTADSCSCPDFQHRRNPICSHIEALRRVQGLPTGAGAAPESPRGPHEGGAVEVLRTGARDRLSEEVFQALRRAEELERQYGDDVFISEDDAAFQALWDAAVWDSIPYEYENVLDSPDVTFGLEIEFQDGVNADIARELYEAGLIPSPVMRKYHQGRVPGWWAFERDGSVSSRDDLYGGEIVSPVLRDTPETWRQIQLVTEIVKRHGGRITQKTGGHIHVGRAILEERGTKYTRLLKNYIGFEDVFYRLAAGGEGGGRHRGQDDAYFYARPARRYWAGMPRDIWRPETVRKRFGDHYSALHVCDQSRHPSAPPTVEFRVFNGTLDPKQIQTNVKIAVGTVLAAARATGGSSRGRFVPKEALPLGASFWGGEGDHSAVRKMVDLLFSRLKDKRAVLALYKTSRWQPRG